MFYSAVLLDLDGTLVDSYLDADQCWSDWALSVGVGESFDLAHHYGRKRADIVRALLPHLTEHEIAEHAERVRIEERGYTGQTVALPGARELLESLGPDQWAIVTSNDAEVAVARLRAAELPLPRVLVSADDVRLPKPAPEGFLLAARRLGHAPAETVAVDDSPIGIEAANAAGCTSIGIRFRHDDASLSAARAVYDNVGAIPFELVEDGALVRLMEVARDGQHLA
ncbi:HAD-IA family hydrolase [Actinomadura macra]|uniref:HAD-IA family hydrolase n=1 Tax=Actinomadura macra TaxID=46164 RepID=UPI0008333412|nr:HAD-IA family hydrolase [Actinomadura macra]